MTERDLRYSRAAMRLFRLGFRPFQRLRLHTVLYLPAGFRVPDDRPVLFVANHVSWWDGFLLLDLHHAVAPDRPLFTPMLAHELRRHPILRHLGALPLEQTTSGVRDLLRVLERQRARDPRFALTFFPQGRIRPSWARPLGVQRGIELLVQRLAPCTVVPVALHVEPLNRLRPTAFVHVGPPIHAGSRLHRDDIDARLRLQLDQLLAHLAEHGESAAAHEPGLGTPARPFAAPGTGTTP